MILAYKKMKTSERNERNKYVEVHGRHSSDLENSDVHKTATWLNFDEFFPEKKETGLW
jgi:hypothetical protein